MRGNTISIKGNLTRDAEERHTQSGNIVLSWGIAWNRSRKNQQTGEYEDVPHYFDCQCWVTERQLQMIRGGLVKGARCAIIDGYLEQQRWETENGTRSKVLIVVSDPINGLLVQLPQGSQNAAQNGGKQAQNADYEPEQQSVYDEDIPF